MEQEIQKIIVNAYKSAHSKKKMVSLREVELLISLRDLIINFALYENKDMEEVSKTLKISKSDIELLLSISLKKLRKEAKYEKIWNC